MLTARLAGRHSSGANGFAELPTAREKLLYVETSTMVRGSGTIMFPGKPTFV